MQIDGGIYRSSYVYKNKKSCSVGVDNPHAPSGLTTLKKTDITPSPLDIRGQNQTEPNGTRRTPQKNFISNERI